MRILVTGVGRSGTTWVATTLATTAGAAVLREPDTVGCATSAGNSGSPTAFYARSSLEERKDTCHPTDPIVTPRLRVAAALAVPWSGKGSVTRS